MEYTEFGPRYRPCEVLDMDFESRRGQFKMYIAEDGHHRIALNKWDHCDTCTLMTVVYHVTCILRDGEW